MNDFPLAAALTNLWVTAAVTLALMVAAWVVGVWLRGGRHDGVDVVWGVGFAIVAVTTLVASDGHGEAWRRWLVAVLTVLWGLRLAWHIATRNRGHDEDPRYLDMLARAPGNRALYALRKVYLTQWAVLWLVSLPVQLAPYGFGPAAVVTALGVLLWLVGFVFETVGDHQLARFRADPSNSGRVLDSGLWRYTRHPNYFGDACVWWGLALLALHHPLGLLGLLSATVMTLLLVKGTGVKLLESTIGERRPGYAQYVRRTSGFVPLPPKPSRASGPARDHPRCQ